MDSARSLLFAFVLNLVYFVVELAGGFWTGSLALLSDAGHMLTDVLALGLALFAAWVSKKPVSPGKTYGYLRAEILGAFCNGILLAIVCLLIFYEAIHRLLKPSPVMAEGMLIIAVLGLLVNLGSAVPLFRHRHRNLNVKGAFIHLMSDALGSVGAIASALIMMFTGWIHADAVMSLFIGLLIFWSAWKIIGESSQILLEAAPADISTEDVRHSLFQIPLVRDVHDLHIWTLASGEVLLTTHLCLDEKTAPVSMDECLDACESVLREQYHINHCTIQLETLNYKKKHAQSCQQK